MGYEYKISVSLSPDVSDRILQAAGHNAALPVAGGYEYRAAGSAGLPSAFAKTEVYGFYLCIYARYGLGAEVLGYIVSAASEFGMVRFEQLD